MTEKESIKATEEVEQDQLAPHSPEEEGREEQDQSVSVQADSPSDSEGEAPGGESLFFEQWKKKHRAYLISQGKLVEEPEETEPNKEPTNPSEEEEEPVLFQGLDETAADEPTDQEDSEVKAEGIPQKVILKTLPIFLGGLLMAAIALYFISPYSKEKQILVTGNERLTAEQIEAYSLINKDDYVLTTALYADAYARNIQEQNSEIESAEISYQFPNRFTIMIKEYAFVGYLSENAQLYPVLSSGEVGSEPAAAENLPSSYTTIQLTDKGLIKVLALELGKVDPTIRASISTISLTPSKVTTDLLTLKMIEGHTILVPASELSQKLPYYPKIASEVWEPTTIDMEVGIFRYAT